MKHVVIRAPLLSKSGYGVHSRQVFQYLLSKPNINVSTQVVPWGITPWYTDPDSCGGLIGEAIRRSDPGESKFDVSFQVILPNEWDASAADINIGITAGVETSICNPTWTSVHCNKMDLVIVPSEHTKSSFLNSGNCQTKIDVVPESYFSELLLEPDSIDLNIETDFNFLTIGVLTGLTPETDRKNLFYLMKWFIEVFRNDQSVGLIIKTNRGRETAIDKKLTNALLENILRELGHTGCPKIYLLHGDMSRKDMNSLYKDDRIKALISATRGEGFGLPLLEASVAGLPVIATNWSAHTEFLNQGKWVKIDYDLQNVHKQRVDNNIFMENAMWAQPREESFKTTLSKFKRKPEIPKQWSQNLSNILKETHSTGSVFREYDRALGDVLT